MIITDPDKIQKIKTLWEQRESVKQQIQELQAEDNQLIENLNALLEVNLQDDTTTTYNIGDLTLKVRPRIYYKVDTKKAQFIIADNPAAQALSENIFKTTLELKIGQWKALSPSDQTIFVDCITETSGKPEYAKAEAKQ